MACYVDGYDGDKVLRGLKSGVLVPRRMASLQLRIMWGRAECVGGGAASFLCYSSCVCVCKRCKWQSLETISCFSVEVYLIYNVALISAAQQSHSVICIYTFLFYILFHYGLSQEIGYVNSSLWYTVGLGCLSILNLVVCIY